MKIYRILILFSIIGCATLPNTTEKNIEIQRLVKAQKFEIKNDWAMPVATNSMLLASGLLSPGDNVGNINLNRNQSYFVMMNDGLSIYLPFYGERRIITTRFNDGGSIKFDGKPKSIKSSFNDKKNEHKFDIQFKDKKESYRIRLSIQGSGSSIISVSSAHRSSISYKGIVKPLKVIE